MVLVGSSSWSHASLTAKHHYRTGFQRICNGIVYVKIFGKISAGYVHIIAADIARLPVEMNGCIFQRLIIAIVPEDDYVAIRAITAEPNVGIAKQSHPVLIIRAS